MDDNTNDNTNGNMDMHNNPNPLFSRHQIILAALLGGPLPAGYLVSRNLRNISRSRASILAKWSGYILALLVFVILTVFWQRGGLNVVVFQDRWLGRFEISLLILFLVHASLAGTMWLGVRWIQKRDGRHTGVRVLPVFPNKKYAVVQVIPYLFLGLGLSIYYLFSGPFRFTFLVIYLLPHIYLYGHLKQVFTGGRSRVIFTGVFLLILLLFPVSMLLNEDSGLSFVRYMQLGGYYYLPVLLYGLLFYVLFDLFRIINYLSGVFPRPAINRRRVRSVVFAGILMLTAIIVAVGIHRFNHTRVHTYQIKVPQRSGKLDHLTIAMAADLHLSRITRTGFVEQFVEKINAQDPDLVLLVGDIVESGGDVSGKQSFSNHFKQLQSKYGVFAVEGNHEHYGRSSDFNFFDHAGITLLRDTVVVVDGGLALIGRRDRHERKRDPLDQLLERAPDSLPRLVMDHQPYHLQQAANQEIDVQFSGHTHHGQLWPLNHITEAIYEISWGHEKIRDTHFFVTCGAQGWGPPVKTSSRSEVMLVEVEFVAD